jgi:hypothetical protein
MSIVLEELFRLEKTLGVILEKLETGGHPLNPAAVIELSQTIALYNRQINHYLKEYADIVACIDDVVQEEKIRGKAVLQYAYDFISVFLDMLRFIEHRDCLDPDHYRLIREFLTRKSELILTNYYPLARDELNAFYNVSIRQQMESDLSKRIFQRYN